MKKRIIGTLAAIIAATSLAITASAETVLTDEYGDTIIISNIVTADGYESYSESYYLSLGTLVTTEYFFPIGGEVEYVVGTYILPEGCTAEDVPNYILGYTAADFEMIDDVTYRAPKVYDVWGVDGTAEEARQYRLDGFLLEGYTIVVDEDTTVGNTSDDTATGDTSDDTAGGTSADTATGNASDDTTTGNTANDTEAESDKASANTGIEGVAAIGGMLLIAGSAALLSRKKK